MEINRQELPPRSAENYRQELARIIREAVAANPEILKEPARPALLDGASGLPSREAN